MNKLFVNLFLFLSFLITMQNNAQSGFSYMGHRFANSEKPVYYVNVNGTSDCSDEFNAINTWNSVTAADVGFQYGGTTNINTKGFDGTNLITWVESDWDILFPKHPAAIAINTIWINSSGYNLESDICFNGEKWLFSDGASSIRYDVQSIATHELGHSISLADLTSSADEDETMYYGASYNSIAKRTLEEGDCDGARYVYFSPTTSGSLTSNEVWLETLAGDIDLDGNVEIPSGKTLEIKSNATVNLNGHSIISTGGTITKESSATITGLRATLRANHVLKGLCSTIQTAANYAGSTCEIHIEDESYEENVTIYNKYNLRIDAPSSGPTHFGTLTLTNCEAFYGYSFGAKSLVINNSNAVTLNDVYCGGFNQNTTAFYFYDTDVEASNLQGTYSLNGLSCYETEAEVGASTLEGNQKGVESYNGSHVYIHDSYFCGTALDLYAYNSSYINAVDCYYDGGVPSITQSSSTVLTGSNRSCPTAKISTAGLIVDDNFTALTGDNNVTDSEFEKITTKYFSIKQEVNKANREKTSIDKGRICQEYEAVLDDFKDFVKNNLASPLAKVALLKVVNCYRRIDNLKGKNDYSEMAKFLTEIKNDKEYAGLKKEAEKQMIKYYCLVNDYETAITTAGNLIAKYGNDEDYVCSLLYIKGIILAYNMGQQDKGAECFSIILQNHAKNSLAELAKNELRIMGKEVGQKAIANSEAAVNKLELDNHPNPFNPTTTINYQLPEAGFVTLKVFDMLGREVASLVNSKMEAGKYSANFDAGNLASGIYIYRITIQSFEGSKDFFTQSNKMLLLK